MKQNINDLKKQIIYRCLYTGTKETDLLYKKTILSKIDSLSYQELQNLLNLFTKLSDLEIFQILIKKRNPYKKYKVLFEKLFK